MSEITRDIVGLVETGETDVACKFNVTVDPENKTATLNSGAAMFKTGSGAEEVRELGGGGLPDVTEADNGDILTVVNGVWDKATPSSGTVYIPLTKIQGDDYDDFSIPVSYNDLIYYTEHNINFVIYELTTDQSGHKSYSYWFCMSVVYNEQMGIGPYVVNIKNIEFSEDHSLSAANPDDMLTTVEV